MFHSKHQNNFLIVKDFNGKRSETLTSALVALLVESPVWKEKQGEDSYNK